MKRPAVPGRPKARGSLMHGRIVSIMLGLAVAALAATACRPSTETSAAPPPPAVAATAAAQRPVPVYGRYVGQTEAVQTVDVRARVEGFIQRQAVPDGAASISARVMRSAFPPPPPPPAPPAPPDAQPAAVTMTNVENRPARRIAIRSLTNEPI